MTIEAHVSIWIGIFVFFGYILSSGYMNIVGSYGSSMEFFEETPYCFPLAAQAYILTNTGLPFSHTLTICYLWPFWWQLFWQVWDDIPLCFWLAFLMTILLAICMPSLENIYSNLLPNFWIRFYEVFFLDIELYELLYIVVAWVLHIQSLSCDFLQPHGLKATRLLCTWDFLSKNTGVGCHFLLWEIFLTQGSKLHLLHWQADSLPLSHKGNSSP